MPKRVLLSGYYGFDNAGDEAVCAAILQTMRTHGGDPAITVLSGNPERTQRSHGVPAVLRRRLLDALPQTDALFQGGGSLLQDATSARSVYYYLWVIMAARIIRRPVFLYAQGIGPLQRGATRAAVRTVLNRVQAITVRDHDSRTLLTEIGVTIPPVYVTADPVWALEPAPDERAAMIWERQGLPSRGQTVGLALRPWPTVTGLAESAARAATALQDRGYDVVFLPFQRPDDENLATAIRAHMNRPAPALQGLYGPHDLMGLTARADLLIAMRLHALIFAAARAVPLLGLSYDPKVTTLMQDLRAPCLDIAEASADAVVSAFDAAWEGRESARRALSRETQRLRDGALSTARLARDFLDKHLPA